MKTRFAPSPTGFLHIGSLRTALFAWLAARSHGGNFYLRIEDTDLERSEEQYTDLIYDGLNWLGLDWDNSEPMIQSERFDIYKKIAQDLIDKDHAYYCDCSKERLESLREEQIKSKLPVKYDGCCRNKNLNYSNNHVLRLKVPNDKIDLVFEDLLHGHHTFTNEQLDDWIILRTGSIATYNFSVVIDDNEMGIDTVIRGDDHLNNTPKQVLLYHLLGYEIPKFCHLPMILAQDGSRLSKRIGSANALHYKDRGILPEALMNTLARLGWSYGDEEVFTLEDLLTKFSFSGLQKSPACIDDQKLIWLNKQHIAMKNPDDLAESLKKEGLFNELSDSKLQSLVSIFQERVETLLDFKTMSGFIFEAPKIEIALVNEDYPLYTSVIHHKVIDIIKEHPDFTLFFKSLKTLAKEYELKVPQIALPLRFIICGTIQAPDFVHILEFLGKDEVINRLQKCKI